MHQQRDHSLASYSTGRRTKYLRIVSSYLTPQKEWEGIPISTSDHSKSVRNAITKTYKDARTLQDLKDAHARLEAPDMQIPTTSIKRKNDEAQNRLA